jgi:hypothetical protein
MGCMTNSHPSQPLDLTESAAGEEDPGAGIDMEQPLKPGDEAPAGTPGTGDKPCAECGGTGRVRGATCSACQGTGRVTAGVGGG